MSVLLFPGEGGICLWVQGVFAFGSVGKCQSLCPGGVCLWVWGVHPFPLGTNTPGHTHTHTHTPGHTPRNTPSGHTHMPPGTHTPVHPHGHKLPPRHTHPQDTPLSRTPPDTHLPVEMAIEAGGTHPTGMYSCFIVATSASPMQ